jgi:hypothetical protein
MDAPCDEARAGVEEVVDSLDDHVGRYRKELKWIKIICAEQ